MPICTTCNEKQSAASRPSLTVIVGRLSILSVKRQRFYHRQACLLHRDVICSICISLRIETCSHLLRLRPPPRLPHSPSLLARPIQTERPSHDATAWQSKVSRPLSCSCHFTDLQQVLSDARTAMLSKNPPILSSAAAAARCSVTALYLARRRIGKMSTSTGATNLVTTRMRTGLNNICLHASTRTTLTSVLRPRKHMMGLCPVLSNKMSL